MLPDQCGPLFQRFDERVWHDLQALWEGRRKFCVTVTQEMTVGPREKRERELSVVNREGQTLEASD